jgi:hypothetical protein
MCTRNLSLTDNCVAAHRRWQFSLRGLLLFTTVVAIVAALEIAFPNAMELTLTFLFFVSAVVLPGTPHLVEKWPWLAVLFCLVLGPWVFAIGFLHRPEAFHHLAIFAIPLYLFATYFILIWLLGSTRGEK